MTNDEMNELDEFLATQVMGWEFRRRIRHVFGAPSAWVIDIGTGEQDFVMYVEDWQPTRKIAQAFEVVEKMRAQKLFVCLQGGDDATPIGWWCCVADEEGSCAVDAETPALAISLAAKKAWEAT